jgi:hypothetical protein
VPPRKPSKRHVRALVAAWQIRLGLTGWTVRVEFGPDAEEAEASCLAQPEYRTAVLTFDLTKLRAADVERTVAHELIHCLVWPLANAANALAKGDRAAEEWVRTEEEALTTALEHLLVPLHERTADAPDAPVA